MISGIKVILQTLTLTSMGMIFTSSYALANSFTRITPLQLPEEPALLSLDNEPVNLPPGPLFINIWASWCKPCIDELHALNAFKARYENSEINWVALNYGDSLVQVNRFMETTAIELPVLLDATTQFTRQLPMKGLPVTFLVDRDGLIRYQLEGYADWTDQDLLVEWERLMTELTGPP
jgi:thiol-disulfide isomerase/thioredoxin